MTVSAWAEEPTERGRRMIADAVRRPFWLDRPERPEARPALRGDRRCDLLVIGAGFTGLWAAVQAIEADPDRQVILVDRDRVAEQASGRNGGFCSASITHGLSNGMSRFADELPTLLRMGDETLDEIEKAVHRLGVDADLERTGELDIANFDWQVDAVRDGVEEAVALGRDTTFHDKEEARSKVRSPMVAAAAHDPAVIMLDPAKLAWGLAAAAERLGVVICENTEITGLRRRGRGVHAESPRGSVTANKVIVATAAARPLRRWNRWGTVPVWDYVLMTAPLTDALRASIGWDGREGLADGGNRFHYFRLTTDNRILFGGWDAVYRYGSDRDDRHSSDDHEFAVLAEHLLQMFPQLEGIEITHAWGGAIDTSSRFCAYWHTSMRGRVVSVLGFTGLGVGASHFGARTALDLVDGHDTERTRLQMVRTRPIPFPPEPLRWIGITITRRQFARADRSQGRRGIWLRTMDKVGLGFDS